MMKNIVKITLGLIAAMFVMVGCNDSDDSAPVTFSVDTENITMGPEGGKKSIAISAAGEWSVVSSHAWINVSPASGVGSSSCEVTVHSSSLNDSRSEFLCIRSGAEERTIAVNQTGYEKTISPKTTEVKVKSFDEFDKRKFEVEILTNIAFDVKFEYLNGAADWLELAENDYKESNTARPRTVKLSFTWGMNSNPDERVAEIHFVPQDETIELAEPAIVTVRQEAALKIEDNRAGDSLTLITLTELINCWGDTWDTSERMENWEGVTLWEANDKDLPCPEAVGRVRSASYAFFKTKETLPSEIRHLKYLESFTILTNENTMLLSIELCPEICELNYLKKLYIFSYGLVSLPDEFVKLGKSLEYLDLSANNFDEIPPMLTPENFPKLKTLRLISTRRWATKDLRKKGDFENGIGLHFRSDKSGDNQLRRLLLWENLEEIYLQNCYIEGELPDFTIGEEGIEAYTQADVDAFGGDTIQWLVGSGIPKVMPNLKAFAINLNFFTGELPDWLLYHPNFMEWIPDALVFPQNEPAYNSEGENVGFTNAPTNFEYYYEAFPKFRAKYYMEEEFE